jgi:pimeloyl-ACP methyl ester carboxylesterase
MNDLLLLHGALGDSTQLEPLKALLGGRQRCHLMEFEGHGRTASTHPYSVARFADNARAYMADHRIERASIFGYSMGGYVALALAADSNAIQSVATLATKLAWTPEFAASEVRRLDPAKIREKVPAFAQVLEHRHAQPGGWETVLARTADFMTGLGAAPVVDDAMLARVRQPALLMVGDRDAIVSLDETTRAANVLPNGRLAVLPETPHPFEQVDARRVADHLLDFLA